MNQGTRSKSVHPRQTTQHKALHRLFMVALPMLLLAGFWLATNAAFAQETNYVYTVREGDSWESVARLTGLSVDQLKEANPDAVRDTEWLLAGEELVIPISGGARRTHTVEAGESWGSIADQYNVSVALLQAANPASVRTGSILYRGERLVIPPAGVSLATAQPTDEAADAEATDAPTEEATDAATVEPEEDAAAVTETPEPTVTITATITATTAVTETAESADVTGEVTAEVTPEPEEEDIAESGALTATESITPTVGMTQTTTGEAADAVTTTTDVTGTTTMTDGAEVDDISAEVAADLPACPERFADYPITMTDLINAEDGGIADVEAFLTACEALVEDGTFVGDLNGDEVDDLVAVYLNPNADQVFVEGDLVIFNSGDSGYGLAYRARAAGEVRLLAVEDINADELVDVVWVDTTCGASTCFDTVNVRSWDGSSWADWTDGTITMAYAEISLQDSALRDATAESTDTDADGNAQGQSIVLEGGIYGSVGAGPQRSRTEVWASVDGAPYALVEKSYSPSECLYHTVIDANRAFLDAPEIGFEAAALLYTKATSDASLIKCWVRNDELAELRSFSLFRLAVIAGYEGNSAGAADMINEIQASYAGSIYEEVGNVWLEAYETTGDAAAACAEVTAYAEENSAAWEILADYGYTNPSFEAADVCPILDIGSTGDDAGDDAGGDAGAEEEDADDASSSTTAPAVAATPATPDQVLVGLPACPGELAGYGEALAGVLAVTADPPAVEAWLTDCGVLHADLGAVVWAELNGYGLPDLLAYPTQQTDTGYGPNGAEGAVFIFHSDATGDATGTGAPYTLIAAPTVVGTPAHLVAEDVNTDGRVDVGWTVTACAARCLLEVHLYTWDGDAYLALIRPGATIANGSAEFTPVAFVDPGFGQQLELTGGVSGTPEGGLPVPHTEVWQSLAGGLYERIRWTYDRDVEESDCMGLRLVEADVALQAAPYIGYSAAIDAYADALDPVLEACSIFDLPASEELALLQGLAAFRLIQALTLNGDISAALDAQASLAEAQPESDYTKVATLWLSEFQATADPDAACDIVAPIFAENTELWQITDHFGYDHPALGPEQVCYRP